MEQPAASRGLWLAAGLLLIAHVGLLFFFGGAALLSNEPYYGGDFDTHIEQTWRFLDGMEGWGRTWVYDVGLLAGYPNGTIFDADNKGWEVWTFLFTRLGMSRGMAFNSFILTAHLAGPFVVYGCARAFGATRRGALWGAGLAVGYWYFDSWCHWCWHIGMVAYAAASYAFLIPLALLYRWIVDRRPWQAVACAVTLGLCHLLHPYSFFMLVAPMLVLWLSAGRGLGEPLGARGHAAVVGIAVTCVAMNLWWLRVAAQFWHYILDSAFFGQATLSQLPADLFGVLLVPTTSGVVGTRTAFRWLAVAGGATALVRWRKEADPRFWTFTAALGLMFAVSYFGAYTPLRQIQPYRHVLPLGYVGCVLVPFAVERLFASGALQRMEAPARVAFGVLLGLGGLHLARDVIYFSMPHFPKPRVMPDGQATGLTAFGTGVVYDYRMARRPYAALDAFVEAHDDGQGRVLVEGALVGEHLVWATDAQVLGGFTERNLRHSYANLFRWYPQGIVPAKEMREYLDRYAVKWVITTTPRHLAPWWDAPIYADLLEKVAEEGPVRAYAVKDPTSLLMAGGVEGQSRVNASTNRIEVTGTDPQVDVVLRYHWLETLVCEPDCELEPYELPGPRVPFMVVRAPHPADFTVVNAY